MRTIISIISLMILLSIMYCDVYADNGEVYTEGLFRYTVRDNRVTIIDYGFNWGEDATLSELYDSVSPYSNKIPVIDKVVIPNRINGMKVVKVADDAFEPIYLSFQVNAIICSDYMTKVRMQSFSPAYVKKVRLGKYTRQFVLKAYQRDDISKLYAISVPEDAKYLKVTGDGALYSKDGKVLFAVPSAKTGSFKISNKTKRLYKWAFHYSHLTRIVIPKHLRRKNISKYAFWCYGCWTKKRACVKVSKKELKEYQKYFGKYAEAKVIGY